MGLRHLEVKVAKLGTPSVFLYMDGWSLADPGEEYGMTVFLRRVPCGGRYLYAASGEDRRYDTETSFTAVLRLTEYETSPPGLPCGGPVPQRSGRRAAHVVLENDLEVPFDLKAQRRRADNSFGAILTLNDNTTCERPYQLTTTFVNPHGRRWYRYRAEVLSAVATLNGHNLEAPDCPLLTLR